MKIKKISSHRLSLKTWQMDLRLPGFVLFFVSLSLFCYSALQYKIICQERIGMSLEQCQLIKRLPLLYETKIPLGTLRHVYLRSYPSIDKTIGVLHNIVLESESKITPLLSIPTPGELKKSRIITLTHNFIKYSHELNYTVPYPQSNWLYYGLLFLLFFSILMIIKVNIINIIIDKDRNVIRIDWQNPFHSTHRIIDIKFLKTVDVQSRLTKKGKRRYRLAFILKDHEIISFSKRYTYFFRSKQRVAIQLNRFLGIMNTITKGETVGTDTSRLMTYLLVFLTFIVVMVIFFSL